MQHVDLGDVFLDEPVAIEVIGRGFVVGQCVVEAATIEIEQAALEVEPGEGLRLGRVVTALRTVDEHFGALEVAGLPGGLGQAEIAPHAGVQLVGLGGQSQGQVGVAELSREVGARHQDGRALVVSQDELALGPRQALFHLVGTVKREVEGRFPHPWAGAVWCRGEGLGQQLVGGGVVIPVARQACALAMQLRCLGQDEPVRGAGFGALPGLRELSIEAGEGLLPARGHGLGRVGDVG